jgi:crotonobetainyl-CoA:carnitine CoA-transferase CaiB-like acyl-CoA transferase
MAPLPGLVADNLSGLLAAVAILGRLAAPGPASGPVYLDVAINDAALIPSLPSIAVLLSGRESQYVDVQEFPHYRIFATADGRHLALGITPWEQSFWDNLCVALDRPDFVSLSAEERRIRSPEIASVLADIFAADTLRGWETRLADVDVPWSPVRNPAEVLSQLNLAERPIVRTGTRVVDLLQTGHSGEVPAVGEANLAVAQWLKQVLGGRWRTRADEGGSGLLAERYLSYCSKL